MNNSMKLEFLAVSENESFARASVAAFLTQLNPTLDEIDDIKTAVSEAVTNAIVHGYREKTGTVHITCTIEGQTVTISVSDKGCGIPDIPLARTPLYTGMPESERSGLGFTVMETFMDDVEVKSYPDEGTVVIMRKKVGKETVTPASVS